ncbi:uncharacterized protein LOC119632662 [Glossina fuscipes]|uniref:Uncharacterized protein LOC119632662 n=1 Tax=Glossina fuscipes TaxID=7396 RepID=A0A8U0W9D0_9MUSC|nr:uncharacterized protein LOC119632662 [Glossina fuscipes]
MFRTATGAVAAIKGKAIRNISISDVSMKHEYLVVDIMDDVILRIDIMAKHSFVLDMLRQVLQYATATLPLTVGYDSQAEGLQIVVQRQQRIPGNSEAIVRATGTRDLKLSKTWVVEPNKEWDIRTQCHKAEYVINHKAEVPKTCSNISQEAEILVTRWSSNLDEQQKKYAKKFLLENWSIVSGVTNSDDRINVAKHTINTAGIDPIRQRPRRIPPAKRGEMADLIKDMQERKVIEPSNSPWCSPVVLVKKKGWVYRIFRGLQKVERNDQEE